MPTPIEWLVLLWLLAFGACVGSFMNVIVFRMPAGRSIVHPGSSCPRCGRAIRLYDNIPVFNWLVLRGRCRDCGGRIPLRYPAVEGLVATVFVALAVVDIVYAQTDDSVRSRHVRGIVFDAEPWLAYLTHVLLMCTVICTALIALDGYRVPLRLLIPAFVAGLVLPVVWPEIRPLGVLPGVGNSTWRAGLAGGITGLIVGAVIGLHAFPSAVRGVFQPRRLAVIVTQTALCGVVMGWQAAAIVGLAASLIFLLTSLAACVVPRLVRSPFEAGLAIAAGMYLVNWRWLHESFPSLGRDAGGMLFGVCGIGLLTSSIVALAVRSTIRIPFDKAVEPALEVSREEAASNNETVLEVGDSSTEELPARSEMNE